jgi:hypothetical protein
MVTVRFLCFLASAFAFATAAPGQEGRRTVVLLRLALSCAALGCPSRQCWSDSLRRAS